MEKNIIEYLLWKNDELQKRINNCFPCKNNINRRQAKHPDHWDSNFGKKLRSSRKFRGTEFEEEK